MDSDRINPELRKAYKYTPALPFHSPSFVALVNVLLKLRRNRKRILDVTVEDYDSEYASVRVYTPPNPHSGAALLWIHGGGLLIGRALINDDLCATYARDLNLTAVSVNYRLASRHPFPAAIDDCFHAWEWLLENAAGLGVDPHRIAISGQSAGGGLAASLTQRIMDTGGIAPAAQALLCPMLDDRTAADTSLDSVGHKMWNNRNNRAGWSAYLGQAAGLPTTPAYAVPGRREDLAGLPPTWIGIGDVDLFYEECKAYAGKLQDCAVNCDFHVAPGAPHAFELLVPEASVTRAFFASNYGFLRNTLQL